MDVKAGHRLLGGQHDAQSQLCVPPVGIDGPSYRLRAHQAHADALRAISRG